MAAEERDTLYDVVIVGGGPAGLTAAIYLARACYRVIVVEKEKFGGQITITEEVVNYPGVERTSGEELTSHMKKQAENFGAEFLLAEAEKLSLSGDIREVHTTQGILRCFGILIATGAHPRVIGFEGEEKFKGRGVAYCATCDGEFFRGKEVFVVGGGYAAAQESVFLTKYARHITILIREEDFTCAQSVAEEARSNEKITVLTEVVVEKVEGDTVLRSITYKSLSTGEQTTYRDENGGNIGVFVFAGYEPATSLVADLVEIDEQGYVITDRNQQTSVEGLYAAGDVCVKHLRQVVTSVGDGALAATELERYAAQMQTKTGMYPKSACKRKAESTQTEKNADKPADGADIGSDDLFTDDIRSQLETVFERMQHPLILQLYLDESSLSRELHDYMMRLSKMTEKLTVEVATGQSVKELPCVRICRKDGVWTGLAFHGVPGGHEFTSFIMGLYNAAGEGQKIEEDLAEQIREITQPMHVKVMVSLSCTMCPELVTAVQRIASMSDNVKTDIYDIAHFPALQEKYQIMSVPCMVINDGDPLFGKKSLPQVLELLLNK